MVSHGGSGQDPQDAESHRRLGDTYIGSRIARLAWFELAAAATRRAVLRDLSRDDRQVAGEA